MIPAGAHGGPSTGAMWLTTLVVTAALGRLFFITQFELAGDEALYWLWSRTLDLSYLTHPPVVAYTIRLITALGFSGGFGVRLGAVLYAAGTTWAVYRIAATVFNSPRAGVYAAVALNCSIGFAAGAVLMTPDAPLLFFWSLTLAFLIQAVAPAEGPQAGVVTWAAAGACLGLALLSKYSAVLLAAAVIMTQVTHLSRMTHRPADWRAPWTGVLTFLAVAGACFSPVIIWNARHGWASLKVQVLHRLTTGYGLLESMRSATEFLLAQVGLMTPPLFLGGIAAVLWLWRSGQSDPRRRLLVWSAALPVCGFTLYGFVGHGEANWTAPAYVAVAVALGGYLARRPVLGGWWRAGLATSFALVVFVHVQVLVPLLQLPPAMDQTNRVAGWRVLGREVDRLLATMPAGQAFILGADYGLAAEAAFYAASPVPVFTSQSLQTAGTPTHLPGEFWRTVVSAPGSQAVFVAEDPSQWAWAAAWFERIQAEPPVQVRRGGQVIRTYYLARGLNFRGRP